MRHIRTLIINKQKYEVYLDEKGNQVHVPPLPKEEVERGKKNMRSIIESGVVPIGRTADDFHRGRGTLLDQMEGDEQWTKHIVQEARKRGYTPSANDVYIGQLADCPGDPKAFFKHGEGNDEIKRRVKASGKGIEAPFLSVEGEKRERPKKKINPNTLNQMERSYRKQEEFKGMSRKALRDHITKTHGARD